MVTLPACAAPTEQEDVRVNEDAIVADDGVAEAITVMDDRLELPLAGHESWLGKRPGSIVIGKPSRNGGWRNPYGFLRRVESVSKDQGKIVVQTTPASLEDVIIEGETSTTAVLDEQNAGPPGDVKARAFGLGGAFDLSNRTILSAVKNLDEEVGSSLLKGVTMSLDVQSTDASFHFRPTVDVGVKIHGASIQSAKIIAEGDLDASIKLSATARLDGALSQEAADLLSKVWISHSVKLAEVDHKSIQFVGFVPVVEFIKYELMATCRVRFDGFVSNELHANLGMTAKSSVRFGSQYDGGTLTPVADASFTGAGLFSMERGASASIECGIAPTIVVLVYDVVGPKLSILPFMDLTSTSQGDGNWTWTAHPGVSVSAGLDFPLKGGNHQLGPSVTIFRWDGPTIADGEY